MIRGIIGLFVFAVALCAYIVVAPGSRPVGAPALGGIDVARAAPQSLLSDSPAPTPTVDAPVEQPPVVETPTVVAAVVPVAPAPPRVGTDDSTILATTSGVLAGLGLEIGPGVLDPETVEIAALTDDVLGEIGAITGARMPSTVPAADTALERLMVAALKEGRSDDEIDRMVNAAAIAGQLTVPEVLVTSDGRVDTHVLLKSIVVQATIASGGAAPEVPEIPTGDGTGVEVRVVQRAEATEQYRFYTVSPGDSLGAIAIKFYGTVDKYPLIFEANRAILSSPDRIRIGQRLAIPSIPRV